MWKKSVFFSNGFFQVQNYEKYMGENPQNRPSKTVHPIIILACTTSFSHPLIELLGAFWFWSILNRDVGLSLTPSPPAKKKAHTK